MIIGVDMARTVFGDPGEKFRLGLVFHDPDGSAGLAEEPRPGGGFLATADDRHHAPLDPHKNGKGIELGRRLRHGNSGHSSGMWLSLLTLVRRTKKECTRAAF